MNKLIKMATIVAGVGAMLGIAGCGASNDPGEIVAEFYNAALDGKDMQEYVKKYATEETIQRMNKEKSFSQNFAQMKEIRSRIATEAPHFENLKVKFVSEDVKVDGDEAKVTLGLSISGTNKLTNEYSEDVKTIDKIQVKKINGIWKLGL